MAEGEVLPKDTHLETLYLCQAEVSLVTYASKGEVCRQWAFVVFLQKTKRTLCDLRLLQSKDQLVPPCLGAGCAALFVFGQW